MPIPNQHWLKRFAEQGEPGHLEVVFWDRGPAGDIVYGVHSDNMEWAMETEFNGFEARLQAKGILLIKMQIYATRAKQCKTFGKRLAREVIGQRILDKQGHKMNEVEKEAMVEVAYKVDADDYRSFQNYRATEDKFQRFAQATQVCSKWMIEDASDRHKCRKRLIQDFSDRIDLNHESWAYHEFNEF